MSKPNSRTNQKMTNDKFWQFRNLAGDDQKAELLLYGDISERSWWEDAATPKRFADDLGALGDVKEITVYINSACVPVQQPLLPAMQTRWWRRQTAATWCIRSVWVSAIT